MYHTMACTALPPDDHFVEGGAHGVTSVSDAGAGSDSVAVRRLVDLVDPGSLRLNAAHPAEGVVGGDARIARRKVVLFATEPTRQAGALTVEGCRRIVQLIRHAVDTGSPVIGIWHSGGARLQDGVASLDAVGSVLAATVAASGRVPQLSLVMGPAAGGAAYGPALTDLVVTAPEARIFVTGPDVVRTVTGADVSADALGGPAVHSRRSGVAHVVASTVDEGVGAIRTLVRLLGRPGFFREPDGVDDVPELARLLPASPRRAYDVRPLLCRLLDDDESVEIQASWARNICIMLGRLDGRTVGVVANNPLHQAGCLDSLSAEKAGRFVRMCDSFGVPLVVLTDVPGYLPGVHQEWEGVVRRGAKLLHAFAEATVPRVTVITRKAYGGAFIAMNSRSLGATAVLAWPGAEVDVMGSEAAVRLLHRRHIAATPERERDAFVARLAMEHRATTGGLARAVELNVVDGIVEPAGTRRRVAQILAAAPAGHGQHGNIPL